MKTNLAYWSKEAVEKRIAESEYRLVVDDGFGGRQAVAHGEYNDMVAIKEITRPDRNPVIEENCP